MDFVLTPEETTIISSISDSKPVDETPVPLRLMRAWVLRRLILGLPLQLHGQELARIVRIPEVGLRIRYLQITDDDGDITKPTGDTGILHLEDACDRNGIALPPLELEQCFFSRRIVISRARFRRLSFKGSRLIDLCADGIHVEGPLNLSELRSAEEDEHLVPSDPQQRFTGAPRPARKPIHHPEETVAPTSPTNRALVADVTESSILEHATPLPELTASIPKQAVQIPDNPTSYTQQGRCWIQLRNAIIDGNLDMIGSYLVGHPLRVDMWNSSASDHAIMLSGSRIRGNVRFHGGFVAVGGIALDGCSSSGLIWGSGATVIGVERFAMGAARVEIAGDLILDFQAPTGLSDQPFRAQGMVNFDAANIGAFCSCVAPN